MRTTMRSHFARVAFLGDIAINVDADLRRRRLPESRRKPRSSSRSVGDHSGAVRGCARSRDMCEEAETIWQRALDGTGPWGRVRAITALSINRAAWGPDEALRLIDDGAARGRLSLSAGRRHRAASPRDRGPGRMGEALLASAASRFELWARWELADALAERGILGRARRPTRRRKTSTWPSVSGGARQRQLAGWIWTALARGGATGDGHRRGGSVARRKRRGGAPSDGPYEPQHPEQASSQASGFLELPVEEELGTVVDDHLPGTPARRAPARTLDRLGWDVVVGTPKVGTGSGSAAQASGAVSSSGPLPLPRRTITPAAVILHA